MAATHLSPIGRLVLKEQNGAGKSAADFLRRFDDYQSTRDRNQEWRDYVKATALRLVDGSGKTVLERPLADIPGLQSHQDFEMIEWRGSIYRVNAIVPCSVVAGATHAFANEVVADEVTDKEPLRDYERGRVPLQLEDRQ